MTLKISRYFALTIAFFLTVKGQAQRDSLDIMIGQMIMVGITDYYDKEERDHIHELIREVKLLKSDWVVQEYVNIPIMTVPEVINGKLDFAYKKYNFNLLVFGDKYAGGFTRLSDESVINVARGGGLVPALATDALLEKRFDG